MWMELWVGVFGMFFGGFRLLLGCVKYGLLKKEGVFGAFMLF